MNFDNYQFRRDSVLNPGQQEPCWRQGPPPQYMPWGHSPLSPAAPLVTFNAEPIQNEPPPQLPLIHCKRKSNLDSFVPHKQHINEERMAAHMSRLHISTETSPIDLDDERRNEESSSVPNSTREKRLYVCEEMRRLQTESVLPNSLFGRIERPCMAVLLWQPPQKNHPTSIIQSLYNTQEQQQQQQQQQQVQDENDNRTNYIDLNQSMDMA